MVGAGHNGLTCAGSPAQVAEFAVTGRMTEATEVADMIAFLASEEASYCTGSAFTVDGWLVDLVSGGLGWPTEPGK